MDAVDRCSSDRRPDRGGRGRGRAGVASRYYSGDSADVSRLLDSLLRGYDQRLRPNYNGQLFYKSYSISNDHVSR